MKTLSMLGLALPAALFATAASPERVPSQPKVGMLAPNFELKLVDGSKVTLDELRGNVIVLNFWATWCVPCREELPLLDRYYNLQRSHGLKVFAITTEGSVPLYKLKPLFAKMTIPSARGIKGPYDSLGGVPTNFVIGRDGRVRYARAGAFDLDALNAILVPLLNERAPSS
ncbi:TlpA family protein disulfide reductase [Sphingomonas sp. DT-204]|uniref:TlpA family protein disulfide reductase n=1 Tax=Sphingomonas sp. DT-204 TaxID=3396166 RepID=UPI003F1AD149